MQNWLLAWIVLLCFAPASGAGQVVFEYPSDVLDAYDADDSCWTGMSSYGSYPAPVVLHDWLVGPPPSDLSAVTVPEDHWVDLLFSGVLVDGPGDDIEMTESGKAGEEAIVFLTDGADAEYPVGMVRAERLHVQALTYIGLDLPEMEGSFAPRALRLVAVDHGGQSPGFDVGYVQARISHECGPVPRHPNPASGALNVPVDANLVWTPACGTHDQFLYFSEVRSQVVSGEARVRFRIEPPEANDVEPPEMQLGRTYYWRVDAVNDVDANDISIGDIWSFTVADHLVVDDFDRYKSWTGPFLHEAWHTGSRGRTSLESERIFRSCQQSLAFTYFYDGVKWSEAYYNFNPSHDWSRMGGAVLRLWLYGKYTNDTRGRMYLTLGDGENEQRQFFQGDIEVLKRPEWVQWRVALRDFNDVNLARVERLTIGLDWPSARPGHNGTGTVHIDDIAVFPPQCREAHRPTADLTSDCAVDYADLEQMAFQWLSEPARTVPVTSPGEPVLWYRFDGTANDSAGTAHGQVQGRPAYADGVHGQAIHFLNRGDAVEVPDAARVFNGVRDAITIAFWLHGEDSSHLNDTLCCSNYIYGKSNPTIAIHLGCWRRPGQYRWDCGAPWSFESRLAGHHCSQDEWAGRWNHWLFTKDTRVGPDGREGVMQIYLNGALHDSRLGPDAPIEDITSFVIGAGWYGRYDGLIDDFQIYDYALSEAEAAYLASEGTGHLEHFIATPADLDGSDRVDLRDFGVLAEQWLDDRIWP